MAQTIADLEAFSNRQEILAHRAAIHAVLSVHYMDARTDIDATGTEFTEMWCNECEMPAWPCTTREILHDVLNRFEEGDN